MRFIIFGVALIATSLVTTAAAADSPMNRTTIKTIDINGVPTRATVVSINSPRLCRNAGTTTVDVDMARGNADVKCNDGRNVHLPITEMGRRTWQFVAASGTELIVGEVTNGTCEVDPNPNTLTCTRR